MPEIFVKAIKTQALFSESEIYGWLIGYQKNNIPHILAIVECKKFLQQTIISAIPDVQEFQEISSVMPQGIGPIGIYHSHPFSGDVFHSHTDDTTLISLSNQFPSSVSIVTNGKEINYYQMGKNEETKDINAKFVEPDIPKFLLFSFDESILIKIDKDLFKNNESIKNFEIKIFNRMSNYLEKTWVNSDFFNGNSKISKDENISKYLASELKTSPIRLKISAERNIIDETKIIIDDESKSNFGDDNHIVLKMDLNAHIPIYIIDKNQTFRDIDQLIKTEIISNNLLKKVFSCVIDFKNQEISTPIDSYINYFGFFLRVLCFNNKKLNEKEISIKNFEFLSKILSQFHLFTLIDLSDKIKNQIKTILSDIKRISEKFTWYRIIKKKMESVNKCIKN